MRTIILVSILLWWLIFKAVAAFGLPPAIGRPIPLYVVSVDNSYARPQVRDRVVRRAVDYWRNYGIKFNRRKLERRADPFLNIQKDWNSAYTEFTSWWLTLLREGKILRGVATHVIAPAIQIGAARYMGGFAFTNSLKSWGAFSYSNCNEYNDKGEYRFRHCVVAVAHELGHSVIGCGHEPGSNLMNANALFEQNTVEGTGILLPLGQDCIQKVRARK